MMEEKNLKKSIEKTKLRLKQLEEEAKLISNKQMQEEFAQNKCSAFLDWIRAIQPSLIDPENEDFCSLMRNLHLSFLKHKTNNLFENKADLLNNLHTAMDETGKKIATLNAQYESYNSAYEKVKEDSEKKS